MEQGIQIELTGTRVLFLNGRLVLSAQPLQSLVNVIHEELAR